LQAPSPRNWGAGTGELKWRFLVLQNDFSDDKYRTAAFRSCKTALLHWEGKKVVGVRQHKICNGTRSPKVADLSVFSMSAEQKPRKKAPMAGERQTAARHFVACESPIRSTTEA